MSFWGQDPVPLVLGGLYRLPSGAQTNPSSAWAPGFALPSAASSLLFPFKCVQISAQRMIQGDSAPGSAYTFGSPSPRVSPCKSSTLASWTLNLSSQSARRPGSVWKSPLPALKPGNCLRQGAGVIIGLTSFVSLFSGIIVLSCLWNHCFIYFVWSSFFSSSRTVNLVFMTSLWPEAEVLFS